MTVSPLSTESGLRFPSSKAARSADHPFISTHSPSFCRDRRRLLPTPRVIFAQSSSSEGGGSGSVRPVYRPTPPDRELRTPHSGYHFDRSARQFFEGWYFKVSIPEKKQNFCFMYSVENPAFRKKLTPFEEIQYGRRFTGVGAQILGAHDKYICQYSQESYNFWGRVLLGSMVGLPGHGSFMRFKQY